MRFVRKLFRNAVSTVEVLHQICEKMIMKSEGKGKGGSSFSFFKGIRMQGLKNMMRILYQNDRGPARDLLRSWRWNFGAEFDCRLLSLLSYEGLFVILKLVIAMNYFHNGTS
jgi:hypothetical protein